MKNPYYPMIFLLFLINLATSAYTNIIVESMKNTQGITITGASSDNNFANFVCDAGDINGDGFNDVMIAHSNANSGAGIVFVLYGGRSANLVDQILTEDLNPNQGFAILGAAAGNNLGNFLAKAGDLNQDGINDIVITASGVGVVYFIYGKKNGLSKIDLSSGLSPTRGFSITGPSAGTDFGSSVSAQGDVDGDSISDIVIVTENNPTVYVIYGTKGGLTNLNVALLTNSQGYRMTCMDAPPYFGSSVDSSGDINHDGIDDIIIGARGGDGTSGSASSTYVVYGVQQMRTDFSFSSAFLVSSGSGFRITETGLDKFLGYRVLSPGDLNHDKIDDLVVTAPRKGSGGEIFIIYGKDGGGFGEIDVTNGLDSSYGTTFSSSDSDVSFGTYIANLGDVNGDGVSDLIIGADTSNLNSAPISGSAYVVYGSKQGFSDSEFSSSLVDNTGFMITSNIADNYLGRLVVAAGDFNNDFLNDMILGVLKANNGKGAAYIIFGSNGCQTNCSKCPSFPEVCEMCFGDLKIYKSQCAVCQKGSYVSGVYCYDCPEECTQCTSPSQCQACASGYTLLDSQRCVPKGQSLQSNISTGVLDGTSMIGNSLAIGSSLPTNFGLVAKILRNIKYLNVTVSSELENLFYTWKPSTFISPPGSLRSKLSSNLLPGVFYRYNNEADFLINYWKTLMFVLIGFGIFVILKVIEIVFGVKSSLLESFQAAASNFTLAQFYSSLDDIIFFFVLEIRSFSATSDPSGIENFSFGISIFFVIAAMITLLCHFMLLLKYQKLKISLQNKELFMKRYAGIKVFFHDFKDSDFFQQSFLLLYVSRSIITTLIFTNLFAYVLVQVILLTILNLAVLIYLLVKRPFKDLLLACAQFFCEFLLLLAQICMLGMAIIDASNETDRGEVTKALSKIVIVSNTVLVIGSFIFMIGNIVKSLYMSFKQRKLPKKSGFANTSVINSRLNIKNVEDFSDQSSMFDHLNQTKAHQVEGENDDKSMDLQFDRASRDFPGFQTNMQAFREAKEPPSSLFATRDHPQNNFVVSRFNSIQESQRSPGNKIRKIKQFRQFNTFHQTNVAVDGEGSEEPGSLYLPNPMARIILPQVNKGEEIKDEEVKKADLDYNKFIMRRMLTKRNKTKSVLEIWQENRRKDFQKKS